MSIKLVNKLKAYYWSVVNKIATAVRLRAVGHQHHAHSQLSSTARPPVSVRLKGRKAAPLELSRAPRHTPQSAEALHA